MKLGSRQRASFPPDQLSALSREQAQTVVPELEPLPGSISSQFVCCGKIGCRCQTGDKHGPYYYRVWREEGRVQKVYVPVSQLEEVRLQCAQYQADAALVKSLTAEREMLWQSLLCQFKRMEKRVEQGKAWDQQ